MSAAEAMETLATRAREASKSFFIEKVFKLLIRKLLCVLDLKMECDWDIAYPLWRKGTYIFPHCGGEYCVKSRGNTLKNINGRSRGVPPGYERVAPTGLCVGFNGYCGPGGCPPATKGPPLRGYAWDSMVIAAPGVAPPATKGSPLRGYTWGLMVLVAPGVAPPGYERVAPTGLCVGFNGSCCPGGCPRATKGSPLRGYVWGLMVIVAPGVAPRLRNGRPYGAIRGAQWFLLPQGCTLHLYDVKG